MKILVVDDERLIRWSVSRMLGRLGHEVVEAAELDTAFELVRTGGYDLVLCDFMMPDGCGDRLFAEVRKTAPDTRFIVMSGNLDQPGLVGLPIDGRIEKPFLRDELLSAIRHATGRDPEKP